MSDRKIKYVDLNGLKFFAEELKDYLHNHVLETSMFNELDTRISALEGHVFYKVLNELPEEPENDSKYKNTIYLVPNPDVEGQHLEYIWTTNGWEQLGVFSFDVVLEDFLRKKDSPFEKGSGENSAVLKGGNNIASLDYSVALGYKTQATGKKSVAEGEGTTASATVSHAEGKNTTASGYASHSEGEGTTASATVSHAEGYNCIAEGNYSHAEGYCTQAINTTSHAEGDSTKTTGSDSHAEGNTTWAEGWASHAEGLGTIANNTAEHACGKFNVSTLSEDISESTQFSIGIGSSDTDRKNAVEVKQNGNAYIFGIGGYDGINSTDSENLAKVVNNKVDKVEGKGLSTNDYTDNDKARVLLGGLHIGNDTQEHRANLALAAAQGACYGPITVESYYGTYIRVGEYHGVYYVDAIVNFSSIWFSPYIVRYRVIGSSGVWSMEYRVDISAIFDRTSIASQSEIDALFDDGTNNGSSTSY